MTLSDEYLTTELSHTHTCIIMICVQSIQHRLMRIYDRQTVKTAHPLVSSAGTHSHLCHQISSDYEPVPFKKVTNLGGIL